MGGFRDSTDFVPELSIFFVFFGSYMNFIGSSLKQKVLVGKVLNILKEGLTLLILLLMLETPEKKIL